MSEPTTTLKIIEPSQETERDGSKFTDPRVREVPTEIKSSISPPSDIVLDYKQETGRPYIAEMMGRFLYDQKIVNSEMDTIDEYVNLEMQRLGMNGKKDAYKEVVDTLSKKMKFSKNIAPEKKVRELATILTRAVDSQKYYAKLGISLKSLEDLYQNPASL